MGLTHGYRKQHLNVVLTLGEKQRGGARLISHSGRADKKGKGEGLCIHGPCGNRLGLRRFYLHCSGGICSSSLCPPCPLQGCY